jgi:hypothetical protein
MRIKLHPAQSAIFKELFLTQSIRFAVACCSRGFGKSYKAAVCAMTAIFELMELPASVPNKVVYIIAPTLDQAKDIYFPLLIREFGLESYCVRKPSVDTGKFDFGNGVVLKLTSFEAIERLRGKGAYFVVCDEPSSWTKKPGFQEAWESIIQPMIVTRWSQEAADRVGAKSAGRALIIGTPKGFNFFFDMFLYELSDLDWRSWQFDYHHSPYLSATEIEKIKDRIDPIKFASEYLASFKDSGSSVFYSFARDVNIRSDLEWFEDGGDYKETIYAAIDFNVGLQCTSLWAHRGQELHCLDELKGHPDTETLALALKERFVDKGHEVVAFPDPSGNSRKTSAPVGTTDFTILKKHGIRCLSRKAAPAIIDSVAAVNAKCMTASGKTSLYVHPRCKGVIISMERTKWIDNKSDSATIDKTENLEHFSDGVRYLCEFLYPVRNGGKRASRGANF